MSIELLRHIRRSPSCKRLVKIPSKNETNSVTNNSNKKTSTQHVTKRKELLKYLIIDIERLLVTWLTVHEEEKKDTINVRLINFLQGLRHLCIEPLVFFRPSIGSCDTFPLLLPSLQDSYTKHAYADHTSPDNCELFNPLLTRQLIHALNSENIKIIHTFDKYFTWEIYQYMSDFKSEEILGILSDDIDFLLLPNIHFIDFIDFDLSRSLKFGNYFNSTPDELNFNYVTLEVLLQELNLSLIQLADVIIISGNIYTTYFNASYKLASFLEIESKKVSKFDRIIEFIRKLQSPVFEREESLMNIVTSIPLYRRALDLSYNLYLSDDLTVLAPPISPIANWAKKRIQANRMSAILYSLTNSCIYWRRPLLESNMVGRISSHDSLLSLRQILYTLLGLEHINEYGSTSEKPFDVKRVHVNVKLTDHEEILQNILDIELLPLSDKVMYLFRVLLSVSLNKVELFNYKDITVTSTDHEFISQFKQTPLLTYSILSISLYLYGHLIARNSSEIDALLVYLLVTQLSEEEKEESYDYTDDISSQDKDKGLNIVTSFSYLLETVLLFCDIIGLSPSLPSPFSLFNPNQATPLVSGHLSGHSESCNLVGMVLLPAVKLLRTACMPCIDGELCGGDPLQLVKLFSQAVKEVEKEKINIFKKIENSSSSSCNDLKSNREKGKKKDKKLDNTKNSSTSFKTTPTSTKTTPITAKATPTFSQATPTTPSLSVLDHREDILTALSSYSVICIFGEAGCGKSSMVPQFILDDSNYGRDSNIIVTQPRVVGVVSLAQRVSTQRCEPCGNTVGYCVGGGRKSVSGSTRLTYCTYGYLLQTLTYHPLRIRKYTHIILDEVHERTTDSDFIMLLIRKLVHELSTNTKIILMSATMQGPLFVNYFSEVFGPEKVSSPLFVGVKRCHVDEYFIDDLSLLIEATPTCKTSPERRKIGDTINHMSRHFRGHFNMTRTNETLSVNPSITSYGQDLCTELILYCMVPNESILVFLPGINEILDYHEILTSVIKRRHLTDKLHIYILHSQVPVEEQYLVLQPPPSGISHVILSTNIAESSLTIPCLRLVINFGICKVPRYDHKRKMTCLLQSWCSKASCAQRSGRVGRLIEGVAIHLFPKSIYTNLPDFNPPEMHTTPLGKLLLKSRQLGEELGINKPSELLKLTIEPPSLFQIEYALQELATMGAILTDKNFTLSETADITILGKFSLTLPFDLDLCRLVFFGIHFGVPVEAIVMATSISLSNDIFSMPSRFLISSQRLFIEALTESLDSRVYYDNSKYSDGLMVCFLFKEWFRYFRSSEGSMSRAVSQFCIRNSLNYRRFYLFLTIISSIADQVLPFVPPSSNSYRQIQVLSLLTTSDYENISELSFCENDSVIYALLVSSFVDNLLYGVQKIKSDVHNEMKVARSARDLISYSCFNPSHCLAVVRTKQFAEGSLRYIVREICPGSKVRTAMNNNVGVVEISSPPPHLTRSQVMLLIWQFCERRPRWQVGDLEISFSPPFSPHEIIWSRLFNRNEKVHFCCWRNNTGFITDFSPTPPPSLGVLTCIQGGQMDRSKGRGLTVLPSIKNSKLSLILILAFQSFKSSIQLKTNLEKVTAFRINSVEFDFHQWQSLSGNDLRNINLLRGALSDVLSSSDFSGNCFSALLMESVKSKIFKLVSEQESDFIKEVPAKCDVFSNGSVQEFYPQLQCSLLGDENDSRIVNKQISNENEREEEIQRREITREKTINPPLEEITEKEEKKESDVSSSRNEQERALTAGQDLKKKEKLQKEKVSNKEMKKKVLCDTENEKRERKERKTEQVASPHEFSHISKEDKCCNNKREVYHIKVQKENILKVEKSTHTLCETSNESTIIKTKSTVCTLVRSYEQVQQEVKKLDHEENKENENDCITNSVIEKGELGKREEHEEMNVKAHFDKGHLKEGHFDKGHLNEGHFDKGHLNEGHFDKGHLNDGHFDKGHLNEAQLQEGQCVEGTCTAITNEGTSRSSKDSLNPLASTFIPLSTPLIPPLYTSGNELLLARPPPGFSTLTTVPPGFPLYPPPGLYSPQGSRVLLPSPSNVQNMSMPRPQGVPLNSPLPLNSPGYMPHPQATPLSPQMPHPQTTPLSPQMPHPQVPSNSILQTPPPGFTQSSLPSSHSVNNYIEQVLITLIRSNNGAIRYLQLMTNNVLNQLLDVLRVQLSIDFFKDRPLLFTVYPCYHVDERKTDFMIYCKNDATTITAKSESLDH